MSPTLQQKSSVRPTQKTAGQAQRGHIKKMEIINATKPPTPEHPECTES